MVVARAPEVPVQCSQCVFSVIQSALPGSEANSMFALHLSFIARRRHSVLPFAAETTLSATPPICMAFVRENVYVYRARRKGPSIMMF